MRKHITVSTQMRSCVLSSLLLLTCTAGAQKKFIISPDMKEIEIIKKGMTEAGDSVARKQYTQWYEDNYKYWHEADSAAGVEAEAWFDNNCDETKVTDYAERTRMAQKTYEDMLENYLRSHAAEYPAAAIVARRLFNDFRFTAGEYDDYLAMLADNPDTVHVNFIMKTIDIAKKYTLGSRYTDFEGTQLDNTTAAISSLMQPGKYTLIDFWASWCGPCRAAIPKIKDMYRQYGDRLQVISVSVDEKEDKWREAEKKEDMPWPQLWLAGEQNDTATGAYAVNAIPRLVLLDDKGMIVIVTNKADNISEKLEAQ